MYALIITLHVIACFFLILIVLVQQGKGGGLIDTLSSAESIFGTKTNTFLVKATSVLSVIFFVTCLSLAFLSVQKSKSLIETNYKPTATTPVSSQNDSAQAEALVPQTTPAVSPETAPAPEPAIGTNPSSAPVSTTPSTTQASQPETN